MEQLSLYLPGILLAFGAFAVGMFSPGPNILAVIGTSMGQGRKAGKALALGIASGSFLWGMLTWTGLTSLLLLYASLLTVIKIAGALYLLWLAYKAFRSAARQKDTLANQLTVSGGSFAYYKRGLLIQMTNPKAALSWIAIMSLGLQQNAPLWVGVVIVGGMTVLSIVGHLIYAVSFSAAPVVSAYLKCRRWIEAGLGTFFCFASYKLFTSKFSSGS
ncbi:MAG: LysE family translocator [Sneathiella sp.]